MRNNETAKQRDYTQQRKSDAKLRKGDAKQQKGDWKQRNCETTKVRDGPIRTPQVYNC